MKVAVLGGYGVFGSRLVRLLVRDGHQVLVVGRSQTKAETLAQSVGAEAVVIDRNGDLTALWAATPDAVVDAAGPFHAYGDDPYKFARACIGQGVHYLDLADDPAFCAGIDCLDDAARSAGVFVLSGVSSVPAISSAAVAALTTDAIEIDTISTAILPGNRAPRGKAVVQSILHQTGRPFEVTIDGCRVERRSWAHPDRFDLGQGMIRPGWMIEVPDHRLFPKTFGARTVLFRAGLELGIMNYGLAIFSWLRGKWAFRIADWFITWILWMAKLLWPFGSDEGGMVVTTIARDPRGWQRRSWRMIARAGEGPFIPAVPARVILRMPDTIGHGARPAVAQVTLDAISAGMADIAVETEQTTAPLVPLFQRQLGDEFDALPKAVRELHQVYGMRRWAGQASVSRGKSLLSRVIGGLFGFPRATDAIPLVVTMTPVSGGELWERTFGQQTFRSRLRQDKGQMTESFGPFTFTLGLAVKDGALHFPVLAGRLGMIPLPRWCLPQSHAREGVQDGQFCFDVTLWAPLTGALIVRYKGTLAPARDFQAP